MGCRFFTKLGEQSASLLKRSLQIESARKLKLQEEETIKNCKHLKIRQRFMKKSCRGKKQLKIHEFFKEFMKFFPIRERFTNSLLHEKLFAEAAKNMPKKQRTNRRSRKIIPINRSEPSIKFIKDEEHAEKAKDFQLSDLAQRTDTRWIREV